jgi:hypothetical protein
MEDGSVDRRDLHEMELHDDYNMAMNCNKKSHYMGLLYSQMLFVQIEQALLMDCKLSRR